MVEKDAVSKDFRKQILGHELTKRKSVIAVRIVTGCSKTYVWQDYDMFPNFPALKYFLAFWEKLLEGALFAVMRIANDRTSFSAGAPRPV
jgi:uncharacterized protein Usg